MPSIYTSSGLSQAFYVGRAICPVLYKGHGKPWNRYYDKRIHKEVINSAEDGKMLDKESFIYDVHKERDVMKFCRYLRMAFEEGRRGIFLTLLTSTCAESTPPFLNLSRFSNVFLVFKCYTATALFFLRPRVQVSVPVFIRCWFLVQFNIFFLCIYLFFSHISWILLSYDAQIIWLVSILSTNYVTIPALFILRFSLISKFKNFKNQNYVPYR